MTLFGLFASLAWAAIAAFFIVRSDRLARRWLDLHEAQHVPAVPVEIPDDLEGFVTTHEGATPDSTERTRDELRTVIRERYAELGDWNKVRTAMGVAPA